MIIKTLNFRNKKTALAATFYNLNSLKNSAELTSRGDILHG